MFIFIFIFPYKRRERSVQSSISLCSKKCTWTLGSTSETCLTKCTKDVQLGILANPTVYFWISEYEENCNFSHVVLLMLRTILATFRCVKNFRWKFVMVHRGDSTSMFYANWTEKSGLSVPKTCPTWQRFRFQFLRDMKFTWRPNGM